MFRSSRINNRACNGLPTLMDWQAVGYCSNCIADSPATLLYDEHKLCCMTCPRRFSCVTHASHVRERTWRVVPINNLMGPATWFTVAVVLEVAGTSFLAAWPIRKCLYNLAEPECRRPYHITTSNLDVWAQSVLHCTLLSVCLTCTLCLPRKRRIKAILAAIVDITTAMFQVGDRRAFLNSLNTCLISLHGNGLGGAL